MESLGMGGLDLTGMKICFIALPISDGGGKLGNKLAMYYAKGQAISFSSF
jgi:hypothetical protein